MGTVTSRDGTGIAYTVAGSGPPLVLVDGALCHRGMGPMPPLAKLLAAHCTVFTYDRRGRGESGDTPPWSIERETQDLAALLEVAGGSARLFGISSGAVLALDAAAHGLPVERLALYEPPFIVDDTRTPVGDDFVPGLHRLLADGDRDEMVRRFMRIVQVPAPVIFLMRLFPSWKQLRTVAHTLPYDLTMMRGTQSGQPLPADRWSRVSCPTLVMDGGKSPTWMRNGCRALAELLPPASYRTLPGQTHMVREKVLAPALVEFLAPEQTSARQSV